MKLTTLDLIAAVMDRPSRPLDWAIVLHFSNPVSRDALERGASSARMSFPSSGSVRDGARWSHDSSAFPISAQTVARNELRDAIERVVAPPMDITRESPLQQFLLTGEDIDGAVLITRVHHALADLVGGSLWLQHQLSVALGIRDEVRALQKHEAPELRTHPQLERKSTYAYRGPSDRLAREGRPPSPLRRWTTVSINAGPLQSLATSSGDLTYNDLLAACALEMYREWNEKHSRSKELRVGLWMPTNIRVQPLVGFGNGTSRIRVYNRYAPNAALIDKARHIRTQVAWSREHGEWAIPSLARAESLPMFALAPLLRLYFNRPWVDMGTGPFSHAQRSPLDELPPSFISQVELMGTLDVRHPFGIFAITVGQRTDVSFVHDPAQLSDSDAGALRASFMAKVAEIACAE
jgi:hypothetical protein